MKILIITDERTGGTSFSRICGAMLGGLYVDDINTHFDNFKNNDTTSWAYNYDIEHNIGIASYFYKYDTFEHVDIYDMINFLFDNGIDIFKLSINDNYWTEQQTSHLVNSLNNNNNNFVIIKLIRRNNFDKILSKCIAVSLYDKIGNQAYDVKLDKYSININENEFKKMCEIKMKTHQVISSIYAPHNNIFVYETFYKDNNEVEKLKKILNIDKIADEYLFTDSYHKDYKSENVTVRNIFKLREIFYSSYNH